MPQETTGVASAALRHRRASELFARVVDLPAAEWRPRLEGLCVDDPALVEEVLELLEADRHADGLESPAAGVLAPSLLDSGSVAGVLGGRAFEERYETLGPLASGGMGTLYLVRHRLLGEKRVAKVLRPTLALDPRLRDQLLREARATARLDHPHLVRTLDFHLTDDGTGLLVMERLHGLDLRQLLRVLGALPVAACVEIGLQLLDGLDHLHGAGFVHRDIAPDNVMLVRPEGTGGGAAAIKIVDLGIARALFDDDLSPMATLGSFSGKVRYAAPERFAALSRPHEASTSPEQGPPSAPAVVEDTRSDLYSTGLVLYELLTGVHPIAGDDLLALVAGHTLCEPLSFERSDRHGRVPEPVRRVVLRALAKDPGARWASAREMRSALEAARPPVASRVDLLPVLERAERGPGRWRRGLARARAAERSWRRSWIAAALATLLVAASLFSLTVAADRLVGVPPEDPLGYRFAGAIGRPGYGPGELNRVTGVAVTPDGELFVADLDNHRVQRFDSLGRFQLAFGGLGRGPGELDWPIDVAIEPGGTVLVSSQRSDRLVRFDRDGRHLATIAELPGRSTPLAYPYGVAVAPDGTIYVVEVGATPGRLTRLAPDGRWLGSTTGTAGRPFEGPVRVVVTGDDEVWLAAAARIWRLDADLEILDSWDAPTGTAEAPDNILGLVVDPRGRILVTRGAGPIEIFGREGRWLGRLGRKGRGPGELDTTGALAFGPGGYLFVADTNNHRVQRLVPELPLLPVMPTSRSGSSASSTAQPVITSPAPLG